MQNYAPLINEFLCVAVSLAPHMDFASYVHQYYSSGFIVYQQGGAAGKVCADDMVNSVPDGNIGGILDKLGKSMCNMLEYRDLAGVEIIEDQGRTSVPLSHLLFQGC